MTVPFWRYDYAKFWLELPTGLAAQYISALHQASHKIKCHGDWLKSFKVNYFRSQRDDYETCCIEIWGEWTTIIEKLPYEQWSRFLRRLDVRGTLWDVGEDAIVSTGQYLQRNVASRNVEVFSSKPASKRLGRDRGGKGFRIGSRKSDYCAVVYRRTGEPSAVEFRFQGQALRGLLRLNHQFYVADDLSFSTWNSLKRLASDSGDRRLSRVYDEAGIGQYWPAYASDLPPESTSLQTTFYAVKAEIDAAAHEALHYSPDELQALIDAHHNVE
jgi:hypothetical protein